MKTRHAHASVRIEHLLTTTGLNLAAAGLLALALCAFGLREVATVFVDWAWFATALAPATQRAHALIAPLFWSSGVCGTPSAKRPRKRPFHTGRARLR